MSDIENISGQVEKSFSAQKNGIALRDSTNLCDVLLEDKAFTVKTPSKRIMKTPIKRIVDVYEKTTPAVSATPTRLSVTKKMTSGKKVQLPAILVDEAASIPVRTQHGVLTEDCFETKDDSKDTTITNLQRIADRLYAENAQLRDIYATELDTLRREVDQLRSAAANPQALVEQGSSCAADSSALALPEKIDMSRADKALCEQMLQIIAENKYLHAIHHSDKDRIDDLETTVDGLLAQLIKFSSKEKQESERSVWDYMIDTIMSLGKKRNIDAINGKSSSQPRVAFQHKRQLPPGIELTSPNHTTDEQSLSGSGMVDKITSKRLKLDCVTPEDVLTTLSHTWR